MSDVVQPGCRIDAALWEQFRQDIKSRRGAVRGHLRTELETALRQYLDGGDPNSLGTVDERLSRIEAAVGVASADGGTDTVKPSPHTHAPTEKPGANAATEKKIAYLAERICEQETTTREDLQSIPKDRIVETVKDEYGFRSDTAERYVQELIDHFGLTKHPSAGGVLVTAERYDELMENAKSQA